MKVFFNYSLALIVLISCTSTGFSQQSPIKNKLAVEYELSVSPLSSDYSHLTTSEKIQSTKFFHTLNLNYRIKSKIAVSAGYGIHKSDLSIRHGEYDYDNSKVSEYSAIMAGSEFNLGLKFYFRNHRAPLGNSFDVFYKNQSYKINASELADYEGGDYKLNMSLLGVKLNYITMFTSKSALYLKYSASFFVPLIQKQTLLAYNPNGIIEDNIDMSDIYDKSAVRTYKNINWFQIQIGLGFAF